MGLVQANNFLAVKGYVLWEKEMGMGGILGQLVAGDMNQVNADCIENIWSVLGSQPTLKCLDDVDSIFDTTNDAWELGQILENGNDAGNDETMIKEPSRCVHGTNVTLPEFADEALRKWIEIFLLDNRKYVPF